MTKFSKTPSGPKLHSLKTVAAHIDKSERSVRRMIEDGTLPSYKIGGAIRVSDDDLVALIARSRQKKDAEG